VELSFLPFLRRLIPAFVFGFIRMLIFNGIYEVRRFLAKFSFFSAQKFFSGPS
jgi:hypothetical protein